MPIKTTVGAAQGVVETNNGSGLQIERDPGHKGFAPFQVYSIKTVTSQVSMSVDDAGVIIVSGSAGIVPVLMPSASLCPGSMWTFINKSLDSHYLSSSTYGSANGSATFNNGTTGGSRLQLANVINQSITLLSDGVNFTVLGGTSSSISISGT